MTEQEWLSADSALAMLGWVVAGRGPQGHYVRHQPVSERKLRLFACACCRAVWDALADAPSRRAVEASEAYADGRVPRPVFLRATEAAEGGAASALAWQCTWPGAEECAWNAVRRLRCDGRLPHVDTAAVLREVVGNPFRPPALGRDLLGCGRCDGVALDDHGCPCRYGPLRAAAPVARAAYDERLPGGACAYCGGRGRRRAIQEAPESERACPRCGGAGSLPGGALDPARLAVLADALEDGGCPEQLVPRHLRSPGPHYRGCWALDLVLGLS